MRIVVQTPYELSNRDVLQIFQARLQQLRSGHFIKDGWVWRVIDMQGRGSDIDEKVAEVGHPDVAVIVAAIQMQELTKDLCPNRLDAQGVFYGASPNHRMGSSVAPGKRCIDCGHFVHES